MAGQNFSVVNNLNSLNAQRNLGISNININNTLAKMSSGLRITQAADDAAGLAIGNALKADYMALTQGVRNANEGIGIVQVADGGLSRISDMLSRATQLATQAASDTVGDAERRTIDTEYQQILQEIDRVVDTTNFKGERLFSQDSAVNKSIYVGDTQLQSNIDLSIGAAGGAGTSAMGLNGTNISTAADARNTLSLIQDAISEVSQMRGALGAQENRLVNSVGIIEVQSQNILAAESAIMDANMANQVTDLMKNRILLESGMASLAQANATNQLVLQLFR